MRPPIPRSRRVLSNSLRPLSAATVLGKVSDPPLTTPLGAALERALLSVANLSSNPIGAQLNLLEDVTDVSGMTLDPVGETHFMIQATLSYLPQLAESLGQARAQGALVLARGEVTPEQRARLSALNNLSRMHMRNAQKDIGKVLASAPHLQPCCRRPSPPPGRPPTKPLP